MLHKEIPFLRTGIPLCFGIIAGLRFHPGILFYWVSATVVLTGFLASTALNRNLSNSLYGVVFSAAMFLYGLFIFNAEQKSISVLEPETAIFSGVLSDCPEEKERSFRMILRISYMQVNKDSVRHAGGSLLLYSRKDPRIASYLPGDRLTIRCVPQPITSRGNPYEFDYRFYMQCQGTGYFSFIDSSSILMHSVPRHRKLTCKALIIREKIITMFRERGIEGDRLALVSAITLGQKNMLDPEQKQFFIKAGIMHIMAVSGLHAVILSFFIFQVLCFLKGKYNIFRIIITLIILWLFAFVTGLTPSVLRATIMFTFLQAGTLLKRPVNPVNSVLASAFVLILIRPSVIFDAGFQLSYSAVLFIVIFYRDLYTRVVFRHRIPDLIWQSVAVTVIAQAGTLPLTVMLFNRFPVWFILSNVVIVPVSSLVIITGCLVPLFYPLKFISIPLARILDHLTGLTEFLTEKAASLPLATIENIGLTESQCILLSVSIFLILMFLLRKKSLPVAVPLSAIFLFILAGTVRETMTGRSGELIVYNTTGRTTAGIRSGRHISIVYDTLPLVTEAKRHLSVLNLKADYRHIGNEALLVKAGAKTILLTSIITDSLLQKLSPDILIVRGNTLIQRNISNAKKLEAVVIAPDASQNSRAVAGIRSIPADTIHFVMKEGCYRIRL